MYFWIGFAGIGPAALLSIQVSQCSIDIYLKHSCVSLEIFKFNKFFLMHIQDPFVFCHELQHLIFKGLSYFLPLILSFVVLILLLLLLEPRLSINLMVILSMSRALLSPYEKLSWFLSAGV